MGISPGGIPKKPPRALDAPPEIAGLMIGDDEAKMMVNEPLKTQKNGCFLKRNVTLGGTYLRGC